MRPDVDYNWTRFSILEERAIYRMAHIKLANPRRALYSQVLLTNFMYSYLAKVQQMHPQTPAAASPAQDRQQKQQQQQQQQQQQKDQPEEYTQYQRYQEVRLHLSFETQHAGLTNNPAHSCKTKPSTTTRMVITSKTTAVAEVLKVMARTEAVTSSSTADTLTISS
jgi:hypothetical protein